MRFFFFIILFFSANAFSCDIYLKHFIPEFKVETKTLCNNHYLTFYDEANARPLLTIHTINSETIRKSNLKRNSKFELDERVDKQLKVTALEKSGYHRGHLVPAEDLSFDKLSMLETFLMTNIVPQDPNMNTGIWKSLENHSRKMALETPLYIYTGTVYENYPRSIDGIPIPSHLFKLIYYPDRKMIQCFLIPNESGIKLNDSHRCELPEILNKSQLKSFK